MSTENEQAVVWVIDYQDPSNPEIATMLTEAIEACHVDDCTFHVEVLTFEEAVERSKAATAAMEKFHSNAGARPEPPPDRWVLSGGDEQQLGCIQAQQKQVLRAFSRGNILHAPILAHLTTGGRNDFILSSTFRWIVRKTRQRSWPTFWVGRKLSGDVIFSRDVMVQMLQLDPWNHNRD